MYCGSIIFIGLNFDFPLFQTHYCTLPSPPQKRKWLFKTKDNIEPQHNYIVHVLPTVKGLLCFQCINSDKLQASFKLT